ncbi:L,D-transpeptidase family protein [Defluviimonas salinarum]|uniref:L,D-transpeptidase family protein n=1 Tax=Defluviimonas salinarum TaxID=2992147 RepID=A0ABT3IX43_9RHOB|nr:L,D-transpeptidase family protein [Defluviimonas salinarum]MCW3779999.1 L,D-transpeptidase family protein [Defluviimonas salinarum]
MEQDAEVYMTATAFRPGIFGLVHFLFLSLFGLLLGVPDPAMANSLAYRQAVAEAAASDRALAEFYRERDYLPLWTSGADSGRRAALFGALDMAGEHGLPVGRYESDELRAAFAELRSERQRGRLEVRVSAAFLRYARDVQTGFVDPVSVDAGIVREVPRRDPLQTLRSFAAADPAAFIKGLPPQMRQYGELRRARLDLEAVIGRGGWGATVASDKTLRPGDSGPSVVALRDRLISMGYLGRTATQTFDDTLQKAVQGFQLEHGLAPDGVAGPGTLAEVNVGAEARLHAVLVAMERLRWMNGIELGKRHIWVNLPDFTAKIVDDGKVTFESVTVVGMNEDGRRSPEFSDQMEFMVVNPTWNVPRSITVKEYLPMLQKNPRSVGHLRITDRHGRVVNRDATDFSQFTASNFPFRMSQPPADDNALGLVKFMFPNPWNIYLHDTPSKSLFQKEARAFSHGCIRLGKPFDFAYALLARQTDDPVGLFERHLKTRSETTIHLQKPVPVHLVYFTAWPSARGEIEYRRDVYGRDARVFDAMQAAGLVLREVRG